MSICISCVSLEVVRLAGTCWEGWVMMPNQEAEEANTLGCCFYWTFHPGAVITTVPSPKIYDGTASSSYCKSQGLPNQEGHRNCSLHSLTSIYLPSPSLSLICFSPWSHQVWTTLLLSPETDCCILHTETSQQRWTHSPIFTFYP